MRRRFNPSTGEQCTYLSPACFGMATEGRRGCTCFTAAELSEEHERDQQRRAAAAEALARYNAKRSANGLPPFVPEATP